MDQYIDSSLYQSCSSLLVSLSISLYFFVCSFQGASALFPLSPSTALFLIWRPPALPHRRQCSTIGRPGLNHRVRDGYGCCPRAYRRQKGLSYLLLYSARAGLSSTSNTLCSFSIDSTPHMHLDCYSHLPGMPVICLYHSICALAH